MLSASAVKVSGEGSLSIVAASAAPAFVFEPPASNAMALAIEDVRVAAMDREGVLENRTALVRGEYIDALTIAARLEAARATWP